MQRPEVDLESPSVNLTTNGKLPLENILSYSSIDFYSYTVPFHLISRSPLLIYPHYYLATIENAHLLR